MPANQYLPFSTGTANEVVTQSAYLAAEWRTRGFRPGILENEMINKVLRQSSVMSAAMAQAVGDTLGVDMEDDGNVTQLVARIRSAFSAAGLPFNPEAVYPPGSLGAALQAATNGTGLSQEQLLQLLSNAIGPTQLTQQILNTLALVDAPTTGLVTQVADLQATYGSTAAAATSAAQAAASAVAAAEAENQAEIAAGAAFTSQSNAASSATTAQTAAGQASASATQSASSASSAAGSANAAGTSATNAAQSATNAGNSASAATTQASNAASSATTAQTAASAASTSATNAQTAASGASTSATNASQSATTAAGSASSANTSAINAANSASAAAGSASSAAGSASTATTQANNAGTSASAAASSATAAQTAAGAASTSATNASQSATNAAGSASSASSSATAAATSASNAGNSATAANTSASNAATYASNASNSAQAAADYYNSTVAATGNLSASVTQVQSAQAALEGRVALTEANYALKVVATRTDGKRVLGGIGVISSANNNVGQSEILLQADRLVFVPSSDPNAELINLLTVQNINGVNTLAIPRALIPQIIAGQIAAQAIFTENLTIGSVTANVNAAVSSGFASSFTFNGLVLEHTSVSLFNVTKQQGPVVLSGYIRFAVTVPSASFANASMSIADFQPTITPPSGAFQIGTTDIGQFVRTGTNQCQMIRYYPVCVVIPATAANQTYTVSTGGRNLLAISSDGGSALTWPVGSTARLSVNISATESKV